jgi:hypothetical protein
MSHLTVGMYHSEARKSQPVGVSRGGDCDHRVLARTRSVHDSTSRSRSSAYPNGCQIPKGML